MNLVDGAFLIGVPLMALLTGLAKTTPECSDEGEAK